MADCWIKQIKVHVIMQVEITQKVTVEEIRLRPFQIADPLQNNISVKADKYVQVIRFR